jgi:rhodanese-related sulfurtransferase
MFEEIDPADLLRRCHSGELWQLLDVREPWEMEIARVDETDNMPIKTIPMNDIPRRYKELEPSRPVAVICHSGARSARVASFLVHEGFSRVANVRGGIVAWPEDHVRSTS